MEKVRKIKYLTVLLGGLFSFLLQADTIQIRADEWCPYNCVPGTAKPGYVIEIAEKVFSKAGHKINYEILNWARSIKETRAGNYTSIVGAFKSEAPDFIFPVNELGFAVNVFYVHEDEKWRYSGIKSLDNISMGVIKDYSYGELDPYLKKYVKDNSRVQFVHGVYPLDANFKKLKFRRITTLVEDRAVLRFHLLKTKFPFKGREAGQLQGENLYIAFSPKVKKSKEYAKILSDGVAQLRKSGELLKILQRYGLKDWKQ